MELKIPNVMMPFLEKKRYKVAAGGRGCVHGDTLLDTPDGQVRIKDFAGGAIYCATDEGVVVGYASKPVRYQPADLFTVTLSDGSEITCTGKHRFLTERGWLDTSSLGVGLKLLRPHESAACRTARYYEAYPSASHADVHHCWKTLLGFLCCYYGDHRPCDVRLLSDRDTFRDVLQRLADGLPHKSRILSHADDRESVDTDSHLSFSRHLSSLIVLLGEAAQSLIGSESYSGDKSSALLSELCRSFQQFRESSNLEQQVQGIAKHVLLFCNSTDQAGSLGTIADMLRLGVDDKTYSDSISCKSDHYNMVDEVTKVEFHSHDVYYDVFVPLYNNYMTNGVISHNSSKSWSVAQMLLIAAVSSQLRILCARELQNSIADSVHRLLCDQIDRLGLQNYFNVTRDAIRCPSTGSEFMFKGLRHSISEIKSLEGIDICWVEEAGLVSEESWEILIPTIRKDGSEIWITFNPDNEGDPTYQRFVKNPPPNSIVVEVNWRDNEYFPDTLRQEMEYCKEVDYESYLTIWEGKPRRISESVIFKDKFEVCEFDVPEDVRFYYGADFGFAKDPSVLVRTWVRDFNLYIDYEAYGIGVDIEDLPKMYEKIPGARRWPIKADGSRPETISAMQRAGFNMSAAKKWSGSVLDGIEYIRGFKRILIHKRCEKTAEEFANYSYKVDRITKDILPVPASGYDHCIDSIRYSLDGLITGRNLMQRMKLGGL